MSKLIQKVRESVIGEKVPIETPFGTKPLIYADYTASGRALAFIEDLIRDQVLPYYANTHTETSFTGAYTTHLRETARRTIRTAVNARDDDLVLFCGSGATAAVQKVIDIFNLRIPHDLNRSYRLTDRIAESERPVVFVGPYEHHSNELPWRESIADVVAVPLNAIGAIDLDYLQLKLKEYANRPLKIGSFSAASNVTGIRTDTDLISEMLHEHGALAFWDYAAAAPYMRIDMQGSVSHAKDCSKDAVFISAHKFVGGPGTPGVLILNGKLVNNSVPSIPGGGTVSYVTPNGHRYCTDPHRREEGGTPSIVESIRAGLVFALQQEVGLDQIERREHQFTRQVMERWGAHPNIEILGPSQQARLPIFSLRIRWRNKDLHYGFVVALLNDLFGIQARGGCSCAGPYAHALLDMSAEYSAVLERLFMGGEASLRPGWVRLNFNYFLDTSTVHYLLRAVELIADHGWRLLPFYQFDGLSGTWRYGGREVAPSITQDSFAVLIERSARAPSVESRQAALPAWDLQQLVTMAESILLEQRDDQARYVHHLSDEAKKICWFALPQEVSHESLVSRQVA
ncbi:MAG: aminotransferase class V-fold PLP-dependent enzyme [Pseudomonadota bacterium]